MQISSSEKLIINFAPTGMVPTKDMTPHVPVFPEEIINDVLEAHELGITVVHLHARSPRTGEPTYAAEIYAKIIGGIRRYAPDLILCVSLSGRDFKEFKQRAEPLELDDALKPDMGSLTLSSLNFNSQASMNEPDMIMALASKMKEKRIKPELEAFDAGMINYAHYLIKRGFLAAPYYFNFILGNISGAQADMLHAGIMLRDLPDQSFWSLGGVGSAQLPVNSVSISLGGGVRVGLEDNIWYDKRRTRLARNIDLLRRVHAIAEENERVVMTSQELRNKLNLDEGYGRYGVKGMRMHDVKCTPVKISA